MERARIDGKGRVTIPKRLREILNLREGEEVLLVPEKDGLLIRKASDPEEILERLLGDLTFSRELRKVAEQEALRETST
ncbi:MAG: AbrB/MazE/SpoVT family DNA-binding domain-containing protein [Infirmifilum sp.]|uniref:AbrB/MazE/SpoVT family DNA-binding domain-containing protein n=1 Tax=Infirmifilum sp. TaxID=2856575 RepID=UPI003D1196F5